jgi:hypothetical protein
MLEGDEDARSTPNTSHQVQSLVPNRIHSERVVHDCRSVGLCSIYWSIKTNAEVEHGPAMRLLNRYSISISPYSLYQPRGAYHTRRQVINCRCRSFRTESHSRPPAPGYAPSPASRLIEAHRRKRFLQLLERVTGAC